MVDALGILYTNLLGKRHILRNFCASRRYFVTQAIIFIILNIANYFLVLQISEMDFSCISLKSTLFTRI